MKLAAALFSSSALAALVALSGCSGSEPVGAEGEEAASVDESELRSPAFSGTYRAATSDDGDFFGDTLTIRQSGPKLLLKLDQTEYTLTKVRSGAYVFSTELSGECDDPGCGYIEKISGVVYLKKSGSAKRPAVKLTVVQNYAHPEYEGDLEGQQSTTVRYNKR